MGTLRKTDAVEGEAVAGKDALFFGEELGCDGGVVWEKEPDEDTGKARYSSFDELRPVSVQL